MKKTIAIVTGAPGGIGREFTRSLLDNPELDEIWAVARNEAKLNMELDGKGIKVTAVCPGWVDTDMLPKEKNGKKIYYPGITTAEKVVAKALKDSRKGRALSICTAYAKFLHVYGKLMPQKVVMKQWLMGIKDLI